jgi:hypothetical protein
MLIELYKLCSSSLFTVLTFIILPVLRLHFQVLATYVLPTGLLLMALQPFVGPWPPFFFFSFLMLYTVIRTPWKGNQPVRKLLPAHRSTQTQNKRTQTSMHWVGFESTISRFELAKAVHAFPQVGRPYFTVDNRADKTINCCFGKLTRRVCKAFSQFA